jgi:plasmid stabilization system protein ParE
MGFTITTTAAAEAQAAAMLAWLREHGDADRFVTDLDVAFRALARSPWLGPPSVNAPGSRRLLLRRWQVHIYYAVDVDRALILIRAIWHTARGEPPPL